MNYNELIQLYFERADAMQAYWNLYVIIVGGLLAFSSMRKQPAAITTALVSILLPYSRTRILMPCTTLRRSDLPRSKRLNSSIQAGAPRLTRSKCVISSSRLLLRPLMEASVRL